jgi:elongation factor G
MDSMELEREKGITIKSAATHTMWGSDPTHHINIIDTPGHVDFTIEVERALRVLDGAVLVLCGVAGVQSQTFTVYRQMERYKVPRIAFINKLDRSGADPWRVIETLKRKLGIKCLVLQIPIGTEAIHYGVIDIITREAIYFEGENGENVVRTAEIPPNQIELLEEKRKELLESLIDFDDEFGMMYLETEDPNTIDVKSIKDAVRRVTQSRKATPVVMGSAFKNKGVQPLLDAVLDYLPSPIETQNTAIDIDSGEPVPLVSSVDLPFVGFAFKLEESQYGQLTYIRVYQGSLKKGEFIQNQKTKQRVKVQRVIRMHSNEMEEVEQVFPGDIGAIFGIECSSGDTFTDGKVNLSCLSMHVPSPVISLAVRPQSTKQLSSFSKALSRFQREDPTFRTYTDAESNETIIAGMGELHLDIYVQRMEREYGVKCTVSKPRVRYRETIRDSVHFDYTLKKQTGGAGQYAKMIGDLEPVDLEDDCNDEALAKTVFLENRLIGNNIPPSYIPAIERGFAEAVQKGPLIEQTVLGLKMVLRDGAIHSVDSSDLAFRNCTRLAFRDAFLRARPIILQPIMKAEVTVPVEFQGDIISQLTRRKAVILDTEQSGGMVTMICEVPLNKMFGYSMDLRSSTEGKGEFVMEFLKYSPVSSDEMETIKKESIEDREQRQKDKY